MLNIFTENLTFIIISLSVIFLIFISYFLMIRPSSYVKDEDENLDKPLGEINHLKTNQSLNHVENLQEAIEDDDSDISVHQTLQDDERATPKKSIDKEEVEDKGHQEEEKSGKLDDEDEKILTADELMEDLDTGDKPSNNSMSQPPLVKKADTNMEEEEEFGKYHILYRDSDKKWYVKRENASRVTRVLHTKKEAIAYATIKAINQDTNIVIHGKDGKIEKHGY